MKKLRFSSGPKEKGKRQGPPGSSRAQPRVLGRIGDHSQFTTQQKKSKHGFLNAMYPTALLSPRNLYKLMQYKVNPNKERRKELGGT